MLTVTYDSKEVLKTWLSLSIEKRKNLLTFKDSNLITIVNCINTTLVLTANDSTKRNYEILESIDTYWTEPYCMKIKPALVKGQKLITLLQSKYPEFLQSPKTLYLDPSDYSKLIDTENKTWDQFQISVCKLIEQAFLTAHFTRLSEISKKVANEMMKKPKEKTEKKVKEEPFFDPKNFVVEIGSDYSTDIDEDLSELMLFDVNCIGGKSYKLRKYYANVSLEWDEEVSCLMDRVYYETHPFEVLESLPIVKYYESINEVYFNHIR